MTALASRRVQLLLKAVEAANTNSRQPLSILLVHRSDRQLRPLAGRGLARKQWSHSPLAIHIQSDLRSRLESGQRKRSVLNWAADSQLRLSCKAP